MNKAKAIPLLMLPVLLLLAPACTVLNFGVGVAISPPQTDVAEHQFETVTFHSMYPYKFTTKVYSDSSVKEINMSSGLFIKEFDSDTMLHLDRNEVLVHSRDNFDYSGYLSHLGKSPQGTFLRFSGDQKVHTQDIETIKFYTQKRDPEYSYVTPFIGLLTDSTRYSLYGSDIENFYMGFDVYQQDSEPYFVEVNRIDKITYRTGIGPIPYVLGGIGLLTDIIVGLLILIL